MINKHIIKGGTILSMDADFKVWKNSFILVEEDKIVDILPQEKLKEYPAADITDASGCLIIPGMINTHSHLPMTYFRGLADDLPLDKWLKEYIWPLEAKMVNAEMVYDASLHGAAEMLKNGICLSNDMYFHCEKIAQACDRAGMRVIVSDAIIAPEFKADPAMFETNMLELIANCAQYPLVDCSYAPHAIYTCSETVLKSAALYAQKHGWMLHTHLSESRMELEDCLAKHSKRPLDYLADLGWLECYCIFAHGVWLSGEELERLGKSNSAIAVCTDSNMKLGNGFAPLKSMIANKVRVSLGSDGVASNNNLDLLEELSTTAKLHKALNEDPEFLPARDALALVTIEAAKALGKDKLLGSIEKGKAADICIIDAHNLQSSPMYNPYSQLVYAMNAHQMRDVMVAGKFAVKKYNLQNLDEMELVETAQEYKTKILRELKQ